MQQLSVTRQLPLLVLLAALLMVAGGATGAQTDLPPADRPLMNWLPPADGAAFALAYGPYRTGQMPGSARPDPSQLTEDLTLIARRTRLLRSYGACAPELAELPALTDRLGLHLWQGVHLSRVAADNARELACYARLAAAHQSIVAGVLGVEVLLRGDLSEPQLIALLQQARTAGRPVSAAETWFQWCNAAAGVCQGRPKLAAAVDFIVAHAHPYWEEVPVEHAAATVVAEFLTLRARYPGKQVVIGETGWPSAGDPLGQAVPSLANQRRFLTDLAPLARDYGVPVMLFEAFDEPWKALPPPVGEDTAGAHWGLFDVNRQPKQAALPALAPPPPALPAAPAVRIDYPIGEQTTVTRNDCGVPVIGRAAAAGPGARVVVDVFTDQWYPQTLWFPDGAIPVVDGRWALPYVLLAGQAPYNNHRLRARLLNAQGTEIARHEIGGLLRAGDCPR